VEAFLDPSKTNKDFDWKVEANWRLAFKDASAIIGSWRGTDVTAFSGAPGGQEVVGDFVTPSSVVAGRLVKQMAT